MKKLFALLTFVLLAPAAFAQAPRVRVYITCATDPSGFVDTEMRARFDAVAAVILTLEKSKVVQLAFERADATVQIEITRIDTVVEPNAWGALANAMNSASGGLNALRPKEDETKKALHRFATVRVGDYSTELHASVSAGERHLSAAIERWVKANAVSLVAAERARMPSAPK